MHKDVHDTPSRIHQLLADIAKMITFVKVIVVNVIQLL